MTYDPDLGWEFEAPVGEERATVTLDGTVDGVSPDARQHYRRVRDSLADWWRAARVYATKEMARQKLRCDPADLELEGVLFKTGGLLYGAEVLFTFETDADPNGFYYVGVLDGEPVSLTRDS